MISFQTFHTEAKWLPQNVRGAVDKYDPRTWKDMWKSIIENIQNQLPIEYRRLVYVGPFPPTDAPLFSRKKSDEIQRAHLFFGKRNRSREGGIEVQIGCRGTNEWKVIAMSLQ